jgi:hypothetical protein
VEHATLDCCPLQHRTLGRLELVEPGAEQRGDRPRNRHLPGRRIPEKRDHLLHEERVSLGGFANATRQPFGERVARSEVLDQLPRLVGGQGLEHDRRRFAVRTDPVRAPLHQIRSCDAAKNERRLVGEHRQLLDELEEGWLGPLDVVEQAHERLCAGGRFEQPADCERDLLGRVEAVSGLEQALERGDHGRVEPELGEPGLELSHDLDHRQVRDPVAVRDAAAANHGRPVERREELVGQARLADARGAEDRDQLAAAVTLGAPEAADEPAELLLAVDHRHVEVAAEAAFGVHAHEPPRPQRLALALDDQRLDGICDHRGSHEPERLRAEQNLVRPC